MTAAATRKLSPLSASGRDVPESANSPAASSGPIVSPTQRQVSYHAAATWRASPATIGSAARSAGRCSELPTPASSASEMIGTAVPANASPPYAAACSRFATTIRTRRGYRSARPPNHEPSTIAGRNSASSTADDRPGGVQVAVRQQQQRDVAGARADARLRPGAEQPPQRPVRSEDRQHVGRSRLAGTRAGLRTIACVRSAMHTHLACPGRILHVCVGFGILRRSSQPVSPNLRGVPHVEPVSTLRRPRQGLQPCREAFVSPPGVPRSVVDGVHLRAAVVPAPASRPVREPVPALSHGARQRRRRRRSRLVDPALQHVAQRAASAPAW